MAHPQSTPRGYIATQRLDVGAAQITANSTGAIFNGAVFPSAGLGGKLTANSTGLIANALYIGAWSTGISVDSTGIKIGSLYISCNSTGNTTT